MRSFYVVHVIENKLNQQQSIEETSSPKESRNQDSPRRRPGPKSRSHMMTKREQSPSASSQSSRATLPINGSSRRSPVASSASAWVQEHSQSAQEGPSAGHSGMQPASPCARGPVTAQPPLYPEDDMPNVPPVPNGVMGHAAFHENRMNVRTTALVYPGCDLVCFM